MYNEYTNPITGEKEYRHIQDEPVKAEKLSKNQKRKLRKGYYSKEHQEKMLSLLIHGKHYQPKANRKGGLVRGQLSYMRKSILSVPVDVLVDRIRQDEKRGFIYS